MILTEIPTNELGRMMRERVTCVLRMGVVQLNLDWTAEFPPSQLLSCCSRMFEHLDCTISFPKNVQRELICDLEFAPWFGRLMALAEKDAAAAETEDRPPNWSNLAQRLNELLEACRTNETSVAGYSEADVLFVLRQIDLTAGARLAYLENFAAMKLEDGGRAQIVKNLSACGTVPAVLDDSRRALLAEPFVGTRYLFASADFEDVWNLFQFSPALADIARMLHEKGVLEYLTLKDYQYFAEDGEEYLRLLTLVLQRLENTAASRFLHHWRENNCALSELQRMERRTRTVSAGNLDDAMTSYTGYINLIYGSRFKNISLYGLAGFQENILIYAITHDKKHFIRLVDEHTDQFVRLSRWSILFHEPLYRSHFNLNELTAKDLKDCGWMTAKGLPKSLLSGDYQYTFAELKLLYNVPDSYAVLYHKLRAPKLDDRIKVLRQLRKRNVLHEIDGEEDLTTLARLLDQKPLADWRREELGHIREIRAEDAAQLLIHLDKLGPLLPGIRCQADVMLALRSLEHVDRFDSVDALKANLLEVDQDWQALANDMELSPGFKARYQEDIIKFLCRDGAGIARTYLDGLAPELHPAFHRVVKAELMGQFSDLKYHTGDLEQELDYPLGTQAKVEWKHNLSLTQGDTEIWERDDFFSTMLLGTQPQETCLSYRDGAYANPMVYRIITPIGIAISVLLTILAIIGIAEKDNPKYYGIGGEKQEKVKLSEYVEIIKNNKPMQRLMVAGAGCKLALAIATNTTVLLALYGILMGNYNSLYLPMMVLGYVCAVPFFLLSMRTSQKLGQKASLVRYVSVALICYVGVLALLLFSSHGDPAFMLSFPFQGGGAINLYTILFIVFFGIGYGAYYATADMPIPMVADCSDYETYRSGKYIPGIMGTLFSLVDKLVSSLAQTLVAFIFLICAGLSDLPTDSTPYSGGIKVAVIVMFCVIPMLAWAATLIAMKGYSLTGEKMKTSNSRGVRPALKIRNL